MTLRLRLSLIIALMGLLAMAAAYTTGAIYQNLVLKHEEKSLSNLIGLEVDVQLELHSKLVNELSMRLIRKPGFKQALKRMDRRALIAMMDDEFKQYYVTTGLLDIHNIYILDKDFEVIAISSAGENFNMPDHLLCQKQIQTARKRTGIERIKVLASPCSHMGLGMMGILTPIGTFSPSGYLQIITSPANQLAHANNKLNMPMQLQMPNKEVAYQSADWPNTELSDQQSFVSYTIKTKDQQTAFKVVMIRDNNTLLEQLSNTRNWIMSVAALISSIVAIIFMWLINRSLLKPLNLLGSHLNQIKRQETELGDNLELTGCHEIQVLNENFNTMSDSLANAKSKLETLAYVDQLTSLPNRSKLQEILAYHTSLNRHDTAPFALFIMDLNRFKAVNDSLGHHAGDILLQQVSERLRTLLRKTDIITAIEETDLPSLENSDVARLGGDEFAAVLPGIETEEDALLIARKITNILLPVFVIEDREFSIGISIGIALCPAHGNDSETLMRKADVAMYQAKNGKLGAALYDSDNESMTINSLSLESDLRYAIHYNELELYFQPKLLLKQDAIIGCEALLRWNHRKQGFIPPDNFVAQAERCGLINELTDWVIKTGIRHLAEWNTDYPNITLAINLSAHNLADNALCALLNATLDQYRIAPERLVLELTETAIMEDPQHALRTLEQLADIGVNISIDDFGTGYSSLAYLKKLPVNELKIDRTFVMDMSHDQNDAIIVKSTIDLAHNMGLKVTAEGVEDDAILHELRTLQCDAIQGYHIARPMSAVDFELWLRNAHWRIL